MKTVVVLLAVFSILGARHALAWEKDVHYGLTLWLSLQAGFSKADATEIAKLTQSEDDGNITPAPPMEIIALLLGDESASRTVSRKHFPTSGKMNVVPAQRPVKPGDSAARFLLDAAIQSNNADALDRLGEALHPFQDSWSHQGIPDVPLRPGPKIREKLAWSHPKERGGWWRHQADLTPAYPADAMATAHATYDALLAFLLRHPALAQGQPKDWKTLVADVASFAAAATKDEKQKWFSTHFDRDLVDAVDLAEVNLPGTRIEVRRIVSFIQLLPKPELPVKLPEDLLRKANSFVEMWLQRQNIGGAVESIDWRALQRQFEDGEMPDSDSVAKWCRKFFTMWLVSDHGSVEEAGHCDPKSKSYGNLPEAPVKEGMLATTTLGKVPALQAGDLWPIELPDVGSTFALIVRFSDVPRDTVIVVFNADGRIVRLLWHII